MTKKNKKKVPERLKLRIANMDIKGEVLETPPETKEERERAKKLHRQIIKTRGMARQTIKKIRPLV